MAPYFAAQPLVAPGRLRLVAVTANGQPAFASYVRERDGTYHAHAVTLPTLTSAGIARIITFRQPGLFGSFGLPQEYSPAGLAAAQDRPDASPQVSAYLLEISSLLPRPQLESYGWLESRRRSRWAVRSWVSVEQQA